MIEQQLGALQDPRGAHRVAWRWYQAALEGRSDFGGTGFGGPMPPTRAPIGHRVHHYRFKVYALEAELEAAAGLTKEQLLERMGGHLLEEGELVGTYERK